MSRLLFLLPAVPEPLDAGARIRNHGLMRLLGADHEVDAIAFGSPKSEAALRELTRRCWLVPPPPRRSMLRRAATIVTTPLPDMAERLWSAEFARRVRCLGVQGGYDAVQAEGIEMARYLSLVPHSQRVYDAHNAEFLFQRRLSESNGGPVARLYSRLQWRRLERFECQVVRHSRITLAVSHHDANQLLALGGPHVDVLVVPNGIDVRAYPPVPPPGQLAQTPGVLFLGKLDFRPNAEALRWFIRDVLKPMGKVQLFAVGDAPPPWLIDAGQHDSRIAVTGYVADERPYLARCSALVLPLRSGGGSRLKALIALASGVPIVSTRVGMEGIEAEAGVHFLQADTPSEWVGCLSRLVGDPALRERLVGNGRELVERRYDWSALRAEVRSAYARLGW